MNYANESEQFVRYSIRYQLLLAQKVAEICSANIYVFEQNDFFETETTVEMVEGIRTIVKDGHRAILSIVVKQVLKNEDQFLYFADKDVLGKDLMGLFVPKVCRSKDDETTVEEVDETKETTVEEVDETKDEEVDETKETTVEEVDETKDEEVDETKETTVEEVDETKETTVEEVDETKELKPILVANLDDVGFTDISELTDTMVKLEPYI